MIESRGDYRDEAFLEQHIGGPLYEHQTTLPRLPVLQVKDTIYKFLPTAAPLADTPADVDNLTQQAQCFQTQSEHLQEQLLERASSDYRDSSWLQHWWNTLGYLSVRDSVVVNVSYFFHLADDPTLPKTMPKNVSRAACILHAIAEHRYLVCSGSMTQETIGKNRTPLCSVAFKYMFHSCRVPQREMDSYRMYDPSVHKHVIVARHGRFYAMDFIDEATNEPLPFSVLAGRLQRIMDMADEAMATKGTGIQVGWLTSQDRDSWADAREDLVSIGGVTAQLALEKVESGAILLCLDNEEPVSRKQCGEIFLHGKKTSAHNRWFDKSIQIMCCNNGKAGFLGEHSMMDGMPCVGLADRIVNTTYASLLCAHQDSAERDIDGGGVEEIFDECEQLWRGSKVEDSVAKAKHNHSTVIDNQHLNVQSFQAYGADQIKKMGFSPDAYVQMAIQLATYRLWGELGATYEATQTRIFLHGRTETTRSVSPASAAFCARMGLTPTQEDNATEELLSRAEKLALLQKAVQSHVSYISEAAKGKGVDRHFLGLHLLVNADEKTPDLFSNPLYQKAKTWRVSTSHLTHPKFDNWGFGQVVPHGVGIGYSVKNDSCIFNLTALEKWDWTERLAHLLEEALLEMRGLHCGKEDGAQNPPQLGSKL